MSSLRDHLRTCGLQETIQPVRPVRIAARRQRELMAVIAYNEHEDVEWLDDEFVDLTGDYYLLFIVPLPIIKL